MGEGSGPAAYGGDPVPAMPFGGGAQADTGHGPQRQGGPRACRTDAPAANNGPGPMGQDGGEMPPERRGRRAPIGPKPGDQAGQTMLSNTTEATPRPTGCPNGAEAAIHDGGGEHQPNGSHYRPSADHDGDRAVALAAIPQKRGCATGAQQGPEPGE